MSLAAEIDRPDDDSLRFFLDYYYVLSCPLSRYKAILFHADTQQDIIGFCIIDRSIRLEPSFSSLFRPRCDSAPRFKGNDGNRSMSISPTMITYLSTNLPPLIGPLTAYLGSRDENAKIKKRCKRKRAVVSKDISGAAISGRRSSPP